MQNFTSPYTNNFNPYYNPHNTNQMLNENHNPIVPVSSVPNTTTAGYANPYSHQSQMYPSSQNAVQPISTNNMNTPLYQNPIFQPSTQAMAYGRGPTKENPLGMNVENK